VEPELYYGTVTEYSPAEENEDKKNIWHVLYDDQDEEHLAKKVLDEALKLYAEQDSPPVAAEANMVTGQSTAWDTNDCRKPAAKLNSLPQQVAMATSSNAPLSEKEKKYQIKHFFRARLPLNKKKRSYQKQSSQKTTIAHGLKHLARPKGMPRTKMMKQVRPAYPKRGAAEFYLLTVMTTESTLGYPIDW
jgi:hypothetical protein